MEDFDYYEILELSKTASQEQIKKAFRRKAMQYHPDRNPDNPQAEEQFKKINEAYEVLSDEEKRGIYDTYGKAGLQGGGRGAGGFEGFGDIFGDIFGDFFGGGKSTRRQRDALKFALDFAIDLELEFKEAIFGCKKEISLSYKIACKTCSGSGASKKNTCPQCQGHGQIGIRQGFMTFAQTCPQCQGSGEVVSEQCPDCKGNGYEAHQETFEIKIPEGVDNGNQIRVAHHGNQDKNGSRGDLYVRLYVKDDEHFIRDGENLYVEVPVFFTSIILGATIKIPSPRKELELEIPSASKDVKPFIFKGCGVKSLRGGGYGDLIAQIKTIYPTKLNKEQKELLEKLHQSFGEHSQPHKSMLEQACQKVKDWFKEFK
ncbi:molecular chaperone DnaJ [Helicobacter enhydrae]|uniref:Chaperone protein DnaJ n=1 Tax=Helicobacter enhydrae TaxID=222136 RepID=A0A1B1U591_9HELI|nr:molecular chaperone DnaJ [Helicobacter enhydrae]ANV97926.1 molecular chaperone DnaJ [Helicobacter enhydrae]